MASPESSDHPAHGYMMPGRIYVRGLGRPAERKNEAGIIIPGESKEQKVEAFQWAQCIKCSETYMLHQGTLLLDKKSEDVPRWPVPSGAVIQYSHGLQWDDPDTDRDVTFFIKPVDLLRWFVPGDPDIPAYITDQLREPSELLKPVAHWKSKNQIHKPMTEMAHRDAYRKVQH